MKLSNIRAINILNRIAFNFSSAHSLKPYSKLAVCRQPQNPHSVFILNDQTVHQFRNRLNEYFPDHKILITPNPQTLKIGDSINHNEIEEDYQQIKSVRVMDAVILNRFNIFEELEGRVGRCYGIEIMEWNQTNNLNIAEHIEEGIIQLNHDFSKSKTVGDVVSFKSIPVLQQEKTPANYGHQNLTPEELQSFNESLRTLIRLEEFHKLQGLNLKPSNQFVSQIIGLMSMQWVFLFAVTYGKYGWDVGEPLSYLSSLGVDLIAMMGIFELENAIQTRLKDGHRLMSSVMNFPSMYRMAQWRISYFRRKIAP